MTRAVAARARGRRGARRASSRSTSRSRARTARRSARTRRSGAYSYVIGAGAAPAGDPSEMHPTAPSTARARLHLHGELLRPQLPADRRPERAADPRQPPAAGLVPAGAGERRRRRTSACRPTRASRRSRGGRATSRTPARPRPASTSSSTSTTSTVATPEGDGRLGADAARDRDPRRRRLGDREQEHPDEPVEVRRRLQRRADRLGGAGVQPQDRQARATAGTRSTTSRCSESQATLPTNGFPWDAYHVNSIDAARRRDVPRLDAQHVGRLPGRHRDRRRSSGRSAAGTRASSSARAPTSSGSTTCRLHPAIDRSRCSTTTAASSPAAAPT